MKYLKNKITEEVVAADSFGSSFYNGDWVELTSNEIVEYKLQETKDEKLKELKQVRDKTNILPIDTLQGYEIIDGVKSNTLVGFRFLTEPTGNPVTEPTSILFGTLLAAAANPEFSLTYSGTIINEDNSLRKGYIAINGALAGSIQMHIAARATNNITICNDIEGQIEAASSIEELGNINIQYNDNLTRFLQSSILKSQS